MALTEAQDLIRIGMVETVSGNKAKVRFQASRTSSMELTILDNTINYTDSAAGGAGEAAFSAHAHGINRWKPSIGDKVLCILIPNGNGQGFIIGSI